MNSRQAVKWLLIAALGLPLAQSLLAWIAGLLTAMGDSAAAHVLQRCGTAVSVLWVIALVSLLIALAIRSLGEDGPRE